MRVLWLDDADARDDASVGGKAASLARLAAAHRVPPGFALAASVHDALGAALDGDARALATLREIVGAAYAALGERTGESAPRVAVRSSAIGEDSATASFAGQHETVLNVRGTDAIADAVLVCWRSAKSERAVAYRRQHGITAPPRVAVLVQQMVDADRSAIAFTADPVSGSRDLVRIDATWGLGEAIASGIVTPDTYLVRRSDLAIVERQVADKPMRISAGTEGTTEQPVGEAERRAPALSDRDIVAVARLALALEREGPVDVECAFARGELYLLQSRPITTLDRARAPEFPVEWDDPEDAKLAWRREDAHHGSVCMPLQIEYALNGPNYGVRKRNEQMGPPVRFGMRGFNGRIYVSVKPLAAGEEMERAQAEALRKRRELARRLRREWDERFLPDLLTHYRWMRGVDVASASDGDAAALWDELWRRIRRSWQIHMLTTAGSYTVMDELAGTYERLTGRDGSEALLITAGLAGSLQRLESDTHELAERVRSLPRVAEAIAAGTTSLDELGALDGGAAFIDALGAFLERHGHLGQEEVDIGEPSWRAKPELLVAEIRRRMRAGLPHPAERLARLRSDADAIVARARAMLAERPDDLAAFDEVVATALAAGPLTEEHNYWLDRMLQAEADGVLARFGERLVHRGVLARADEIYLFYKDEVRDLLRSPRDATAQARARAEEVTRWRGLRAPQYVGVVPETPVALGTVPSTRIDLLYTVKQDDASVLRGVGASPGRARGPARLLRGAEDFDKLEPGDVLVCRSTQVSWVPLFSIAGAVVTEVGGALSHAAVVAREVGVPCVVATGVALSTFTDGELVDVDGTEGTVRRVARV